MESVTLFEENNSGKKLKKDNKTNIKEITDKKNNENKKKSIFSHHKNVEDEEKKIKIKQPKEKHKSIFSINIKKKKKSNEKENEDDLQEENSDQEDKNLQKKKEKKNKHENKISKKNKNDLTHKKIDDEINNNIPNEENEIEEIESGDSTPSSVSDSDSITPNAVMEAIYNVQSGFFYDLKPYFIYNLLLTHLMKLTESSYGLMGDIKEYNNKSYIVVRVIIQKNEEELQSKESNQKINYSESLTGTSISEKKIIISKSPQEDSYVNGLGLPRGHPIIHNFMAIPFLSPSKEKILAISVVCNRIRSLYNWQHIKNIQPYIKTCENLVEAHKNHQIIKLQEELLKVSPVQRAISPSQQRNRSASAEGFNNTESSVRSPPRSPTSSRISNSKDRRASSGNAMVTPILNQENNLTSPKIKIMSPLSVSPTTKNKFLESEHPSIKKKNEWAPLHTRKAFDILEECVEEGDCKNLKKLLNKKKFLSHLGDRDSKGQTLLHLAIKNNDYEMVDLLLEHFDNNPNCDVNAKDFIGYTPLHVAVEFGYTRIIMSLLLCSKIETNVVNNSGSTPFHYFCQGFSSPSSLRKIFDAFLARKTDINTQDLVNGETPLHKAILNRVIRGLIVRLLLEHKVNVNVANSKGDTPLHYCVRMDRKDLIEELLYANADLTLKNKKGMTPLDIAKDENCSEEIISLLTNAQELLTWFVKLGLPQYVSLFIQENIFIDVLHLVDEKILIDMGISKAGDRMRILNACKELKLSKETELSINKDINSEIINQNYHIQHENKEKQEIFRTPPGRQRPIRRKMSRPVIPQLLLLQENESKAKHTIEDISKNTKWITYTQLEFTKQLSSGSSGQVYKGFYEEQEVAIKVLEKEKEEDKIDQFKYEFKVFSSLRSPNIVNFYGACIEPRLCLVMEYCSRGSVYDILSDSNLPFGWKEMLGFSIQMVQGINCLHSFNPQILHRDIKSMNFLVDQEWCIKVCDFGLSRFLTGSNMSTFHKLRGTAAYIAPETCKGEQYTTKSDIYSLGICLWEMSYRCIIGKYQTPFSEYQFENQIQLVMKTPTGLRPSIPNSCPQEIQQILQKCWDNEPFNRPSCNELLELLKKCQLDLNKYPESWEASEHKPKLNDDLMNHFFSQ